LDTVGTLGRGEAGANIGSMKTCLPVNQCDMVEDSHGPPDVEFGYYSGDQVDW
jgi:hypothetical protein